MTQELCHKKINSTEENSWQTDLHHPHLSCSLGFWFNKDGACPMFIG